MTQYHQAIEARIFSTFASAPRLIAGDQPNDLFPPAGSDHFPANA
jgi:hypothetical protein